MRIDQRLTRATDSYLQSIEYKKDTVELDIVDASVILNMAIGVGEVKRENDRLRKLITAYDKKIDELYTTFKSNEDVEVSK